MDANVLQAIAYLNLVMSTRERNLWPEDIKTFYAALAVLGRLK